MSDLAFWLLLWTIASTLKERSSPSGKPRVKGPAPEYPYAPDLPVQKPIPPNPLGKK